MEIQFAQTAEKCIFVLPETLRFGYAMDTL